MGLVQNALQIWRDYVTDGVPSSGAWQPKKSDIRAWGAWLESLLTAIGANSGSVFQTRSALFADLAHAANSMAWVVADSTAAYNGIYQKVGSSGSGSWTRVGDLPYSLNVASDVGAGTANAIQATTSLPVSSSQIIVLTVFENNTGSPVTISFNGGGTYNVKDFLGRDLSANELQAGAVITGVISGSTFRLLYDQKYPYAKAVNVGAGTANAMVATIPVGVDFLDSNILIGLPVTATNTAAPVTVAFNGNAPLTIKTNSGNDPVAGGLVAGTTLLGFVSGGTFRLISDQASAAIQAAAEAAAEAASDYADFARNNWVANGPFVGTGVETDYQLTIDPGSANNMFVVAGGVSQLITKGTYSLVHSGGSHYIRINLPAGVEFEVRISNAVTVNTPADGSVGTPKLAAQAVTTPALADDAVTYAKMANISATLRLLGRKSAGAGDPEEITAADLRDLFLPAGAVVDSVVASYATNADLTTQIPSDDTIPQITEGTQVLSATITPKSINNKLRIRFTGWAAASAIAPINFAIFNGAANAIHAGSVAIGTNGYYAFLCGEVEYVPGATTAQTISVRVGPGGAVTVRMNGGPSARLFGGVSSARLVIEEIKA